MKNKYDQLIKRDQFQWNDFGNGLRFVTALMCSRMSAASKIVLHHTSVTSRSSETACSWRTYLALTLTFLTKRSGVAPVTNCSAADCKLSAAPSSPAKRCALVVMSVISASQRVSWSTVPAADVSSFRLTAVPRRTGGEGRGRRRCNRSWVPPRMA